MGWTGYGSGRGREPPGPHRAASGQHPGRQHVQRRTTQVDSRLAQTHRPRRGVPGVVSGGGTEVPGVWRTAGYPHQSACRGSQAEVAVHPPRGKERAGGRTGALAHAITPSMPMYASFQRPISGEMTLWYQPTEYENVGPGAMYEVTGNAYKHIALTSQRRASTHRQLVKDGEVLATHVRMSTGRTRSDGASNRVTKLYHQRLPTDARIELWAGRESGELVCGYGHKLS